MYAVVDLETTGGLPENDNIIEVAIYLHDGSKVTEVYSRLVNPGTSIPPFISRLTGITEEMVVSAPSFSEIAGEVAALLENRIFVAHNVMFDYSFISHHLQREGFTIDHRLFCTCHSGRKLLPGHASYSLGKLCRSLGISLKDAHRASADAQATVALLELMLEKTGGVLDDFLQEKYKKLNTSAIPDEQLDALPPRPGVLYFRDANEEVIFVAKSKNVKKKAWAIVSKFKNNRYAALAKSSAGTDHVITGGNIMAAILETHEVARLQPRLNRKLNTRESRFCIYSEMSAAGHLMLFTGSYNPEKNPIITFNSAGEAKQTLKKLCAEFGLFYPGRENNNQLIADDPDKYNKSAETAIEELLQMRKNFILIEKGPDVGMLSAIVIKDAVLQGYVHFESSRTVMVADDLLDIVQPLKDSPAVMNSIIRCISKGEFLKIIHFK